MPVLDENDIVIAVRDHIAAAGWTIEQFQLSNQHGPDVLAERSGDRLRVEAKGATSSKVGSKKYGVPFDSADVEINLADALYKTCVGVDAYRRLAIAFQDDELHRRYVGRLASPLRTLGIGVFWVAADTRAATLEAAWQL